MDNYHSITENQTWLEDKYNYSRFTYGPEESIWVCNHCEAIDVDPYERICDCPSGEDHA